MIVISGLIPDFSSEHTAVKKSDALMKINYDNTIYEIEDTIKTLQQKYSGKKHTIMLIAYSILTVAAIVLIVLDYKNIFPYIALLFCGFNLYYNLTDRKRMRNKIIEAIKDTNDEEYTASVFDDRIEIETVILPKEYEDDTDAFAAEQEEIKPVKNIFIFGQDMLDFAENEKSLLLIVARRQAYCFPKRCFDTDTQEKLRSILKEKTEM